MNINNPNKQVEQISRAALSVIYARQASCNWDSAQLHNKVMRIASTSRRAEAMK